MRTPIWSLIATGVGFLLTALAGAGAVLVSSKATDVQRRNHPVLRKLDGKKIHLTLVSVCLGALAAVSLTVGYVGEKIALVRIGLGPGTGIASLATYDAFEREISDQTKPQL